MFRFPPVVSRALIEKSGYLKSFPHLLGCVCALGGERGADRGGGGAFQGRRDLDRQRRSERTRAGAGGLLSRLSDRRRARPDAAGGLVFDVAGDCFRREPSRDIDRLQSFRMREFVAIGAPEQSRISASTGSRARREIAGALGLSTASRPRAIRSSAARARWSAAFQVAQALKFEMLVPVRSAEQPTACMSFNYHRDHFGLTWGLRDADGEPAHTACVAFGIDRLAVALFAAHGLEAADWPKSVREALAL